MANAKLESSVGTDTVEFSLWTVKPQLPSYRSESIIPLGSSVAVSQPLNVDSGQQVSTAVQFYGDLNSDDDAEQTGNAVKEGIKKVLKMPDQEGYWTWTDVDGGMTVPYVVVNSVNYRDTTGVYNFAGVQYSRKIEYTITYTVYTKELY